MACVFAMLLFPVVRLNWDQSISNREKRTLSSWPDEARWRRLDPQLGRDMENWLNDRFGGRDEWLDFQAQLDVALNGFIRNDDIFSGREGWLFYNKEGSVQSFQNADLFDRYERQIIRKNIVSRADWLKTLGSSFFVLVIPAKNRVYGEFYPSGIQVMGPQSRVEQMVQNLQANTTVPTVFALNDLLEAKKRGEPYLYFQQDTHWTDRGAFIGYQALMDRIRQEFPEIRELQLSDFEWKIQAEVGGDLTHLARLPSFPWISKARYTLLERSQPFPYHTVPTRPGEEIHTLCPGRPFKVWVFMDSFGYALQPFLSSTFGEVVYVRSHLLNEYQDALKADQPNLVIHQVAERLMPSLLVNQPPLKPIEAHAF